MPIEALTIHRLRRYNEAENAELTAGSAIEQISADHQALFSQLKKLFHFKTGKHFGELDSTSESSHLLSWVQQYQAAQIPIDKLSALFCDRFKSLLEITSETIDAFVLTTREKTENGETLYFFVVETKSELVFTNSIELDTVDPLNTGKLDLALRVDLTQMEEDAGAAYAGLVKGRGTAKIGDAFEQACAFKSSVNIEKDTDDLINLLTAFTSDQEPKEAASTKQKAYEFCVEQQQLGEAVPIQELSGYLNEESPEKFASFVAENGEIEQSQPIHPDTRKLKHLVRFSGKGNGLSLNFSSDLMHDTVLYDKDNDTLTITAIPKSLKKQLLEHLEKENS